MLSQLWYKGWGVLAKLVADLGIIHMMLVLLACKMQELRGQGVFHPDFKGKPGRPGKEPSL